MQIKDILDSLFEYDTCTDNRYIIPKLPYKFGSLPSTSNSSSQMDTSNSTLRKAAPIGYPKFNIVSINLQIGNFTSTLHTKTSIKHGI